MQGSALFTAAMQRQNLPGLLYVLMTDTKTKLSTKPGEDNMFLITK